MEPVAETISIGFMRPIEETTLGEYLGQIELEQQKLEDEIISRVSNSGVVVRVQRDWEAIRSLVDRAENLERFYTSVVRYFYENVTALIGGEDTQTTPLEELEITSLGGQLSYKHQARGVEYGTNFVDGTIERSVEPDEEKASIASKLMASLSETTKQDQQHHKFKEGDRVTGGGGPGMVIKSKPTFVRVRWDSDAVITGTNPNGSKIIRGRCVDFHEDMEINGIWTGHLRLCESQNWDYSFHS